MLLNPLTESYRFVVSRTDYVYCIKTKELR